MVNRKRDSIRPATVLVGIALALLFALPGRSRTSQAIFQRSSGPFVPVAVSYELEPSGDVDKIKQRLANIRGLGFNTVRITAAWSELETAEGKYQLETLERALEQASAADLKAILQLDTNHAPAWLFRRFPDGRFVPAKTANAGDASSLRPCLDHADVRAATVRFINAATERAAKHASLYALEIGSDPPAGFCLCPHTARRYRDKTKAGAIDRAAFVALTVGEHLAAMVDAASGRGGRLVMSRARTPSILQALSPPSQDDWVMTTLVQHYGTSVPLAAGSESTRRNLLSFGLDGLRSAAGVRGWWMNASPATPEELRMWGWTAMSRGARALVYADEHGGDRFANVITRNPALFSPLRPKPSNVAIVHDPRWTGSAAAVITDVYDVLFARNIQVDFIHVDDIRAGNATRYRALVVPVSARTERMQASVSAFASAGGQVITVGANGTDIDQVADRVIRAGVAPEVRIEGGHGHVETRFLESSDVLMLIGLNHGDAAERVTMTFAPDTQEAIWQNMETGSAVNFIAGPEGPVYSYSFRPRDALVLMIRKDIR
jgi:hypothetical protein